MTNGVFITPEARMTIRCDEGTYPLVQIIDDSATMRLEHSSWTTLDMGNAFVMESFILFLIDTLLHLLYQELLRYILA